MSLWMKKTLVVMISILTFGMVSPTQASEFLSVDQQKTNDKADIIEASPMQSECLILESETSSESITERMKKEAEQKSLEKFGSRIGPVIEDEFRQVILPNIEHVIATLATSFPEEYLENLAITEVPNGGHSEKIFHITGKENKDLVRFHVRRDRPPHEGYWFNFHYHTYHDQFQAHYELGTIFWAKNTPPKWKS